MLNKVEALIHYHLPKQIPIANITLAPTNCHICGIWKKPGKYNKDIRIGNNIWFWFATFIYKNECWLPFYTCSNCFIKHGSGGYWCKTERAVVHLEQDYAACKCRIQ